MHPHKSIRALKGALYYHLLLRHKRGAIRERELDLSDNNNSYFLHAAREQHREKTEKHKPAQKFVCRHPIYPKMMHSVSALRRAVSSSSQFTRCFYSYYSSFMMSPSSSVGCTTTTTPTKKTFWMDEDLSLSRRSFRRSFRRSSATSESSSKDETETKKNTIKVTFTEKTGEEITVNAEIGKSLMEAAHDNDVELEGACEGSLACSTCHVVVEDQNVFDKLPEACDDENDMLDLAFGLTETSRLGCQIIAKEEIDGIRVKIPAATRNFAVDGFVPKPH